MYVPKSISFGSWLLALTIVIVFLEETNVVRKVYASSTSTIRKEEADTPFLNGINKHATALIEKYGKKEYQNLIKKALGNEHCACEENVHCVTCPKDCGKDQDDTSMDQTNTESLVKYCDNYNLDKKIFHEWFLQRCREHYETDDICDRNENNRISLNALQPASMENYTELGFRKTRIPEKLFKSLNSFYEENKHLEQRENWPDDNVYSNNWLSPTYMVDILGGGNVFQKNIWETTREMIHEWTGEELTPSSLYGIRIFKKNAYAAPHVSRLPLVFTAVINVAQDLDEPWPIEILSHNGHLYNITMQPGDMLLLESQSIIHGQPFPLRGRFHANVFVHFEPVHHSYRDASSRMHGDADLSMNHSTKNQFENSRKVKIQQANNNKKTSIKQENDDLPVYIERGGKEELRWKQLLQEKVQKKKPAGTFSEGSTVAHRASAYYDLEALKEAVADDPDIIYKRDENGWQPIHEAARGGLVSIIEFLYSKGADINSREGTNGKGGSPLWWAKQSLPKNHEALKRLVELGAKEIAPGSSSKY